MTAQKPRSTVFAAHHEKKKTCPSPAGAREAKVANGNVTPCFYAQHKFHMWTTVRYRSCVLREKSEQNISPADFNQANSGQKKRPWRCFKGV